MHPLLNTAVKAARRAGNVIVRHLDRIDRLQIENKGHQDFVSEVDRAAEAEIIDVVRSAYPDHAILAEESGQHSGGEFEWVIDPLDGTTNFLHGFPQFAVSIGVRHRQKLDQAVVFDPLRSELFTATRGQGAHLNNRRIRVSNTRRLEDSLLATGFPFREMDNLDQFLAIFRTLLPRTSGIRRAGSAALDLAYVAAGRCDGFWEFGLRPWDMAAGCLLIQEAGGLLADMQGGRDYLETGNIVAATPNIYAEMLRLIQTSIDQVSAS
jgi:myo-inositol-1(or 4)-monophosphatase